MCGICGIVYSDENHSVEKDILTRMRDVMIHRGPDDQGMYLKRNVGLGFRRLSIIDLKSGHQPMCNEDSSIWLVFNGEIYNHSELRAELSSRGHDYKTRSDVESIIHLYEQEGVQGFKKMNGMFAFAIWDEPRRLLILVRDRLGIKPLYYARTRDGLIFASEIKSILEDERVARELNREGLEEFLTFRFLSGENTLFRNIFSLMPGHILTFQGTRTELSKFWDAPTAGDPVDFDEESTVAQLNEFLCDSVRLQLMSDVPLGCFCSGGVDSSLTTAYATKLGKLGVDTFSVGFEEADFDESRFALMVSRQYQTRHHTTKIDNRAFADSLPRMIWHNDEPLNHPNSIPIYHISKLAKQFVKVVLTGEGSDELFAGYPRYIIANIYSKVQGIPLVGRQLLKELFSLTSMRRLKKLGDMLPLSTIEIMLYNSAYVEREMVHLVLNGSGLSSTLNCRRSLIAEPKTYQGDLVERVQALDLRTYLVSLLSRMDKMTMAASIEARVPFLDHRLVEWSIGLSRILKLKGMQTKYIVKKLGLRFLPRQVVLRPKSGFGVPISSWLRDKKGMGRYLDLFSEPKFEQRDYFKTQVVQRLAQEHLSGKVDHGEILWGLINLELWHRVFIDNEIKWLDNG
jgi:asparagine synthase (glutamine-hydrolysing)